MVEEIIFYIVNTLQKRILVLIYQIKKWEFKLISISISLNFKSKDYEFKLFISLMLLLKDALSSSILF